MASQGIIQLLPDHIANQIAAGEVIQRPASVVKEMVENAIDAGAKAISVIIKDAGRTLIQIIDDGNGMNEKDAVLCFQRHATSKISSAEDLFRLNTKGFRGEALASIAAIAHVTLKTKQKESIDTGTKIEVEGNRIKSNESVVCPIGTSFEVKNIFYNVPARRNFLKSDNVEFGHIREEFERIALAHPEVKFVLHHNGKEEYNLLAGPLRKRIVDIFGKSSNEQLVPVEEETEIVKIKGYIGKPETARKTRGEQFLFVNNRFFKDSYFHHAISKAFEGLIPEKTFPTYFIYFEINPNKIDVNIHPTKTEIKFEEDRFIYSILLSSIKQALGKYNVFPTLDFEIETSFDVPVEVRKTDPVEPQIKVNPLFNPFHSNSSKPSNSPKSNGMSKAIINQGFGQNNVSSEDWENFYSIKNEEIIENKTIEFEESNLENTVEKPILIRGKYIITTCKSGLLLIDSKRAKERIIYQDLMGNFIHHPISSQQLLFSFDKKLSKIELTAWIENETLLKQLGFTFEIDGELILLSGIPGLVSAEEINAVVDDVSETLLHREIEKGELAHGLIAKIALNVGKNNPVRNLEDGKALIDSLFQLEEHAFTPNGKTIISTLSLDELAQKF
jgi:DNA mismatch repair protein MutL